MYGRRIEEKALKMVEDMTIYGPDEWECRGMLLIDVADAGVAVLGAAAMELAMFPYGLLVSKISTSKEGCGNMRARISMRTSSLYGLGQQRLCGRGTLFLWEGTWGRAGIGWSRILVHLIGWSVKVKVTPWGEDTKTVVLDHVVNGGLEF
jgi:hypothetical protein